MRAQSGFVTKQQHHITSLKPEETGTFFNSSAYTYKLCKANENTPLNWIILFKIA